MKLMIDELLKREQEESESWENNNLNIMSKSLTAHVTYNSIVQEEENESLECVLHPSLSSQISSHRQWTHLCCQHQSSWWSTLLLSELGKNTQDARWVFAIIVSPAFVKCILLLVLLFHNLIPCRIIFCMFTLCYILYSIVCFTLEELLCQTTYILL